MSKIMERICLAKIMLVTVLAIGLVCSQVIENCEIGTYPPPKSDIILTEVVNLDEPPRERWRNVVLKRKNEILDFISYVKQLIPSWTFRYISELLATSINKLPAPYNEEIIGIADYLNAPLGDVLACNIFYELEKLCTSIVSQDKQGHIYHARNLDLGAWLGWDTHNNTWRIVELLRPMTVNIEFQRNGDTIYKTVQFAGTVGVFTGVKPEVFSFSLNSRSPQHVFGGPMSVIAWLLNSHPETNFASFLGRDVLEKANSFNEANEILSKKPVMAPAYYILAGVHPYEGSVITRSKSSSLFPMKLDSNHWYVVQTNYDNWKTPPFYDNRRKPAKMCLDQLQPSTKDHINMLYDVLSTEPMKNKATIYTALMSPRGGHLESYRRYCKGACYPW